MRETQFLQRPVNRGIRYRQTELSAQLLSQIAGPPAHHLMNRLDRPLVDETSEKLFVHGVEFARCARRRLVAQTFGALIVEPDHPVPERLTLHAADLRGLFARGAIEYRGNRQKSSRLPDIIRLLRNPPAARVVRPHRNSLSHGKHPS